MRRALALLLLAALPLSARVARVDVASRADIAYGYERIEAKVFFAFDPANAHNAAIADLDKAERPEAAADLVLLRPKCGGNDTLHLEIPNRGGLGRSSVPARDDFLYRRGSRRRRNRLRRRSRLRVVSQARSVRDRTVKTAYGFGISQSGRFLRHFLYDGFNADEDGRQVFDGLLVHVAGAGRGNFNHRFAQPSRDAQPIVPAFYPVDVFPFTDLPTTEPVSGKRAGLLDRAVAENVVPKIFYMNTGYEYWSRGGSLIHTTPDGSADVAPPPTTRIYALTGHGHIGGPFPPERPKNAQQLQNFLNYWPLTHALVDALDGWVKKGTAPPPSRYPRISDGTLVPTRSLPGAPFAYQPFRIDASVEPPRILGNYAALVPQTDADGNELGGVRMPFHIVPVATFSSWNLRDAAAGFPQYRASFLGSLIPFSRAQVAARYGSRDEYVGRFTAETLKLIEERCLVREDLHGLLQRGNELWEWVTKRE